MVIAIGTDIIEIGRIKRIIERSKRRFLQRVFTDAEIHYCENRVSHFQHYAARFAVKEAMLKALGTGWADGLSWKQIEIRNNRNGAPEICLSGRAREMCKKMGVSHTFVSISHCEEYAVAHVVLERDHNRHLQDEEIASDRETEQE